MEKRRTAGTGLALVRYVVGKKQKSVQNIIPCRGLTVNPGISGESGANMPEEPGFRRMQGECAGSAAIRGARRI
jgi:hypothetical protein